MYMLQNLFLFLLLLNFDNFDSYVTFSSENHTFSLYEYKMASKLLVIPTLFFL